ncbi:cysteine-rich with EGF-like domain protein 2 isoform X1 [Nilaparvata lugens]|uniref:cysteine-rich with EGF-like domain protein 2 isoform X1 n=1 Tax=Nilaparvata lugens TaxID=108931 RepID=UPI00193D9549|nr:cysteine-rich with EGF-like domain protein 2 isoform X1 [Nilaparvata lugens]
MIQSPFCIIWLLIISNLFLLSRTLDQKEEVKNVKLAPCQLCRTLVDSFKKGIEKTEKGNFEGGDSAWEEERRLVYAKSEVRFVEIQERLCSEVERGQAHCQSTAELWEHHLENWWNHHQDKDLYDWLCIETVEDCCPTNHYGRSCSPCLGYPNNVCSGNGRCKGNGTRKGNGECKCDNGYDGTLCDKCAIGYYVSYQDELKLLCSKCHTSCDGECTQAGPKGCLKCKSGWMMSSEGGCLDIDECISDSGSGPCSNQQFCINKEGSYTCLACDPACDGCNGDGPDMCTRCAQGFILKDNLCVDGPSWDNEGAGQTTRYITYLGLCIATFIIFQKNPIIASFIGILVGIYITVSEYMLDTGTVHKLLSFITTL